MKKIIFSLIAIAAICSSCNKNEPQVSPEVGGAAIYASIEDDATKTTYDEGSILWADGDQIFVLNAEGGIDIYTLSEGNGTKNGVFTSTSTKQPAGFAVYPVGNHKTTDGTDLTVNLPTSYGDASKDYAPNTNVLMLGTATGTSYSFKHLGAAICVTVGAPIGTAQVSLTAKGIAGDFPVTVSEDGQMLITKAAAEDDGQIAADDPTVSYQFKAITESQDMVFYFPVPTGEYKVLKVELKDADGAVMLTRTLYPYKSLGRAQIAMLPKLTIETKFDFDKGYDFFGIWGANAPTKTLSDAEHVSGTHSLLLSNPTAGNMWDAQLGYDLAYNLDMNKTYYVSFNVKSDVAGQIQFLYQSKDYSNQAGYLSFNTTTEWQLFKTMFTPAYDDIMRLIINFGSSVANYYIDDFCFGEVEASDNLITNGDFEFGFGGWADMTWNTAFSYEISESGHTGNCALCTFNVDNMSAMHEAQLKWPINLTLGKVYSYSFWAKSDSGIKVQVISQTDDYSAGIYNTAAHTTGTEWEKFTGTLDYTTGAEGMAAVILQFGMATPVGSQLWIDDVVLTEI